MPEEEKKRFGCLSNLKHLSKTTTCQCFQTNTNTEVTDRLFNNYCNWLFQLAEEEDRLQDLMNIQELELEDSEEFQVHCQELIMKNRLVCSHNISFL